MPTTGKLYHHKMKLRRLNGKSTVAETLNYLRKRHPLYFLNGKVQVDQITDLLKRLIYRLKQKEDLEESKKSSSKDIDAPVIKPLKENAFKSGTTIPSIDDTAPSTVLVDKAKKMFDDLEDNEDEFDANELMNLGDYKGKRDQKLAPLKAPKALTINEVFDNSKKAIVNAQPVEESDDWGLNDLPEPSKKIVMDSKEAMSKDLNKLGNEDLAAHKRGMDVNFEKNQLKPGDAGYVYDKVVNFTPADGQGLEDDSWGEDDGVAE